MALPISVSVAFHGQELPPGNSVKPTYDKIAWKMLVTVVGVGTYDAADISRLAVELKPALIRWFLDAGLKSWRKKP